MKSFFLPEANSLSDLPEFARSFRLQLIGTLERQLAGLVELPHPQDLGLDARVFPLRNVIGLVIGLPEDEVGSLRIGNSR